MRLGILPRPARQRARANQASPCGIVDGGDQETAMRMKWAGMRRGVSDECGDERPVIPGHPQAKIERLAVGAEVS